MSKTINQLPALGRAPAAGDNLALMTSQGVTSKLDYAALADAVNARGAVVKGQATLSASWTGSGPYAQSLSIAGATANSKIDLQPDAALLARMAADGVTALWVQNDGGALTVCALGAPLSASATVQYTRTEVAS